MPFSMHRYRNPEGIERTRIQCLAVLTTAAWCHPTRIVALTLLQVMRRQGRRFKMSKKCPRCVLVIVRQRLHIDFFFLSATFSPFLFLDTRKPTCFYASGFKLAGSFAISQTLSLGSSLLLDLYKWAECKGPPRPHRGPTVAVVPASVRSALVRLTEKALFAQKTYYLKPSYVHDDTETLLSPWYVKMDDNITSLTTSHLAFKTETFPTSLFTCALTLF